MSRTEVARVLQTLIIDVQGNDLAIYRSRKLGNSESHRPLADNEHRCAAWETNASQRIPRRARTAGNRGAGFEAQFVRQVDERAGRHLQIASVTTMRGQAIASFPVGTHLCPAGHAFVAAIAALVVMHHDAGARPG